MTSEQTDPLVLRIGPGHAREGTFALRISPEHVDEVTGDLRAAGFEPGEGLEFSQGPALALFFVAFAQAGGIEQLATGIRSSVRSQAIFTTGLSAASSCQTTKAPSTGLRASSRGSDPARA